MAISSGKLAERLLEKVEPEDYTSFNELQYDIATGNTTNKFESGYGFPIIDETSDFKAKLKQKWDKAKEKPKGIIENVVEKSVKSVVGFFKGLFK